MIISLMSMARCFSADTRAMTSAATSSPCLLARSMLGTHYDSFEHAMVWQRPTDPVETVWCIMMKARHWLRNLWCYHFSHRSFDTHRMRCNCRGFGEGGVGWQQSRAHAAVGELDETREGLPDENWSERMALQVQETLCEGSGRHLHAALVAAVDLEVVAVGGVQPQQAATRGTIPRVHHRPEVAPQLLRLHQA